MTATVFFVIVALGLLFYAAYSDWYASKGYNIIKETETDAETETVTDEMASEYSYEDEEDENLIRYNGKWYGLDESIRTYLFIGVDKYSDEISDTEYHRNSERSDFICLVAVNDDEKTITPVLLNRDTMTRVTKIGVTGEAYGTEIMQLALSHTYGSGKNDSCENVCEAVSDLFYDLPVDKYYSVTMDAVPVINDAVGGVSVYIDDKTLSNDDPEFVYGETVLLTGEHALNYVRARMGVGSGTNLERMERQKAYLKSIKEKALLKIKDDSSFAVKLVADISEYSVTNLTVEEVFSLSEKAETYTIEDITSPEGTNKYGTEFMEFYPSSDSIQSLLLDIWYKKTE